MLGDGSALFGVVYIDNVAHAHVLAAEALIRQRGAQAVAPPAGQAYFIGENNNVNYFEFMRPYVECKQLRLPRYHLPWTLWYLLACLIEVAHFLLARVLGFRSFDPVMHRYHCYVIGHHFNFKHDKATRDFGYRPRISKEEARARTLEWMRRQDV